MAAQLYTVGLAGKWSRILLRHSELTVLATKVHRAREAKATAVYELPVLVNWVQCTLTWLGMVAGFSGLGSRDMLGSNPWLLVIC